MRRNTIAPTCVRSYSMSYSSIFYYLLQPWAQITGTEGRDIRIWSRDGDVKCPPKFCHVSNFQAPGCLHYNAVKSLPTS